MSVPRSRIGFSEEKSQFESFLTHPLLIYHINVTSATAATLVTSDLVTLYRTTASATALGAKIKNLSYFTGELAIKVVVQGQPFAAGLVNLAFYPQPDYTLDTNFNVKDVPTRFSQVNSFVVPHLSLDPSKDCTYEISLPCVTPTGKFSLVASKPMGSWQLEIVPVVPLFSGTAVAASMSVCVYMHLQNTQFEGLTLLSNDFVEEKKEGGTLSVVASQISDISGSLVGLFPPIDPFLSLFSTVTGVAGQVLSFLGFSKPPATENFPVILNRFNDNYSQFDGKSTALVLAGSQKTALGLAPQLAGGLMSDNSLDHIVSLKGLVQMVPIPPSAGTGAILAAFPVEPTMVRDAGLNYDITPLAGASVPFSYWSGDIIFDFIIVASVFHRLTLLIAWDPNGDIATLSLIHI